MTNMDEVEVGVYEDVNDFARAYFDEVPRIAELVYKERGVVESDDIAQAIWEYVVTSFDKAFSGVEKDEVLKRFRIAGRRYVAKEAVDLQHFRGDFLYSPEAVRQVLESGGVPGDDEFGEVDSRIDVEGAFEGLSPKQKAALAKRYSEGVAARELSKAEQSALYRGVDSITNYLNRGAGVQAVRIDAQPYPVV